MTMRWRWVRIPGVVLGLHALAWPGQAPAGPFENCFPHIDNCSDVPRSAQPAPAGSYIARFIKIQETKAEQDDFVIYKHMWFRGGTELGPLGRYQLEMIMARLPGVPFPVVIETSKNDKLDEQRRQVIVAYLGLRGFGDASRVLVAFPIAGGLYGAEAPRVYNGLIGLTNINFFNSNYSNGFGSFGSMFNGTSFNGFNSFGGFGGYRPF
jgi:hypothetical protein